MDKTYGILMSSEMVLAYKEGAKTQTRRTKGLDVVNKNPDDWRLEYESYPIAFDPQRSRYATLFRNIKTDEQKMIYLPYGGRGNTLWFKETYALICKEVDCGYCNFGFEGERGELTVDILAYHDLEYRADSGNLYPGDWPAEQAKGSDIAPKWQSSMFMRRAYSRFVDIPILNVRVERLKDITDKDAIAEGYPKMFSMYEAIMPVTWYYSLWDKLNGDKLPVYRNPWVWVYEFPTPPQPSPNSKVQERYLERGKS